MPAGDALGPQFGTADYAASHHEEHAPVRAARRQAQVDAAKTHVARARTLSQAGDRPGAAKALQRAAVERKVAAAYPR